MAFDPKLLVPAAQVAAFAKNAGTRTTKQVALANVSKMKELYSDPKIEGRRHFKVEGDRVAFTLRVNNTALVLEKVKVKDTEVDVQEMTAPKAQFLDALDYYAAKIEKGDYDTQLAALSERRDARTSKMRTTRAERKAAKPA